MKTPGSYNPKVPEPPPFDFQKYLEEQERIWNYSPSPDVFREELRQAKLLRQMREQDPAA